MMNYRGLFLGLLLSATFLFGCTPAIMGIAGDSSILAPRFSDLQHGAYRGGKMLYAPGMADVNQLNAGLIIPIKMVNETVTTGTKGEAVYQDIPGSRIVGFVKILAIADSGVDVEWTLYSMSGVALCDKSTASVTSTTPLDLNRDGSVDLEWLPVDRPELAGSHYLNFVCSKENRNLTMFQLDPRAYGGELPYGIVSITPSGKFIINEDANTRAKSALNGRSVAPSFLRDDDFVISENSPKVDTVASRALIATTSGTETTATGADYDQYSDAIDNAANIWEVLDLSFSRDLDAPATSNAKAIDWKFIKNGIFNYNLGPFHFDNSFDMGFFLDANVTVRWLAIDFDAEFYLYSKTSHEFYFKPYEFTSTNEFPVFQFPEIPFSVCGIPCWINLGTVKLGYTLTAQAGMDLNFKLTTDSKFGYKMWGTATLDRITVNHAPYAYFTPVFTKSENLGRVSASEQGEVYLSFEPRMSIASIVRPYGSARASLRQAGSVIVDPVTHGGLSDLEFVAREEFSVGATVSGYVGVIAGYKWSKKIGFVKVKFDLEKEWKTDPYVLLDKEFFNVKHGVFPVGEAIFGKADGTSPSGFYDTFSMNPVIGAQKVKVLLDGSTGAGNALTSYNSFGVPMQTQTGKVSFRNMYDGNSITLKLSATDGSTAVVDANAMESGLCKARVYAVYEKPYVKGATTASSGMLYGQAAWLDPRIFDVSEYLRINGDLTMVSMAGLPGGTIEEKALYHWVTFGINEGRISSIGFKVSEYRAMYGDLQAAGLNNKQLVEHYLNWGISEGRRGCY